MQVVFENKKYSLIDDHGVEIGSMVKHGRFTYASTVTTNEGSVEISKAGIFKPLKITRNGREIGSIKFSFNAMKIKLDWENRIKEYRICRKSFWKTSFKITNEQKEEIAILAPRFKLKKFKYDFDLGVQEKLDRVPLMILLLLAVYGTLIMMENQYAHYSVV